MTTIIQGSPEWFAIRLGKVTASRISDVVAKTKTGGWGASRANYAAQLIAERLTGTVVESYTNGAMQWGTATEPAARLAYADTVIEPVTEVGFIDHPTIGMSGASPDGLVGADGLVEVKCPNTATHIETLLGGKIPEKYICQMLWQMDCAERQWCDFVSYDPRLPKEMQLFVKRLSYDGKKVIELGDNVIDFLAEIDHKEAELRRRYLNQQELAA
jgi:putative phage-type endonuclease